MPALARPEARRDSYLVNLVVLGLVWKSIHHKGPGVLAQKFAKQVRGSHIVMPAKAGIQVRDFTGFRVALAIASLPGMTDELCSELRGQDTSAAKPQPKKRTHEK